VGGIVGRAIRAIGYRVKRGERGYVYILVLIFLLVGALMIPPLLEFMKTGVGSGRIFEQETEELYACDAGVDDALWQIKYENLPIIFTDYDEYDYDSTWSYDLAESVNEETVSVEIQNMWVPKDITPLSKSRMRGIVEGTDEAGARIRVNGSSTLSSEYRIRIDINPDQPWALRVDSIGVWLPSGFSYVDGSSNLEYLGYSPPFRDTYAGGEVVVWDLSTPFDELPPIGSQQTVIVEFEYTSETAREMVTVSWTEVTNTTGCGEIIPFAWDDDTKVYAVTSSASSGTVVESKVYLFGRYSSLLDNAITSPGSTDTPSGTTVNGIIECPPDGFDEPENGVWEYQEYDEEWPDTGEWRGWFASDATVPCPGSPSDIKDYSEAVLGGTIYCTGDIDFAQPGTSKAYTLNLNWQTIFVEGAAYFAPGNITVTGSGCIIAIGDVSFQPNVTSDPGDFIFVCSLEGTVNFNPSGAYSGSVAGQQVVGMQPGTSITWRPPPGGLNLPGMGGGGTGGFGNLMTKYTWQID
jgi:hypothetical protein